ncbi:MAG TPA: hypothetical protein ENJ95_19900 [Bacteroidetes bacterium]|nr:hypothetical protein [Bacteroidota bacterium]
MNLQKLNAAIGQYKSFLKSNRRHDPYWKWESLKIFQENWDIETAGFRNMFDRSLQNSQTRRLWKRENYAPKEMMLKFIGMNSEFVRYSFQDLFNEKKDIEGRVDRFVFYCDELLKEYKEKNPLTIENRHFHDDNYEMVSVYLAFRYPDIYAPYNFGIFKDFLKILGSLDVPKINDVGRYFKIMRTVDKFLKKDEEIFELHKKRLNGNVHFAGETLLVVEDFCRVVVGI